MTVNAAPVLGARRDVGGRLVVSQSWTVASPHAADRIGSDDPRGATPGCLLVGAVDFDTTASPLTRGALPLSYTPEGISR